MDQYAGYLEKLNSSGGWCCGLLISTVNYWIFPEDTLEAAAIAVLISMILDIFTKYWYLSKNNGGYRSARKKGIITSQKFWEGTSIKLVSYAVIVVLAGLSYRVTSLEVVGTIFSGVAYGVMFWREVQSIGENLETAGGDVAWLRIWAKKNENKILDIDSSETVTKTDTETKSTNENEGGI